MRAPVAFFTLAVVVLLGSGRAAAQDYDCTAQSEVSESECEALVALYNSTYGWLWRSNAGWLSADTPISEWRGVTVSGGSVTKLDLNLNNVGGVIPPEIGDLVYLEWLYLQSNHLSGWIPPELGNLAVLDRLVLSGNRIQGRIPPELQYLSSLKQLDLSNNLLTGGIPPEIGNLAGLWQMHLSGNSLTGSIPGEMSRLTTLRTLDLSGNSLSGSVPPALGDMIRLEHLYLDDNDLTGPIPNSFVHLAALSFFHFQGTDLCEPTNTAFQDWLRGVNDVESTGTLCDGVAFDCAEQVEVPATECQALVALYDSTGGDGWNNASGWFIDPISEWIGVVVTDGHVTAIDLAQNDLSGRIPPELGGLGRLQELRLHGNDLRWSIPLELGELSELRILALHDNQLIGLIPPELGGLTQLQVLALHGNILGGEIPAELGRLTKLRSLGLADNQFHGTIPAELGQLVHLEQLWLHHNSLHGTIPPELGQLNDLWDLSLGQNGFSGPVPVELGGLAKLEYLDVSNNRVDGPIPLGYTALDSLRSFNYHDTRLCEPQGVEFQMWLGGIAEVNGTGVPCTPRVSNLRWVRQGGASISGVGRDVTTDGLGHVYVTGTFHGEADFGRDGVDEVVSAGAYDIFVARYSAAGTLLRVQRAGGANNDVGYGIVVDRHGNVYLTGFFTGGSDFDGDGIADVTSTGPDDRDVFVAKYDAASNLEWVRRAGGASTDTGSAIAADGRGGVYVTGRFSEEADFDGDGIADLISVGGEDVFTARYDPTGQLLWVRQIGGPSDDGAGDPSVSLGGVEHVYVATTFQNEADVDGDGAADFTSAGFHDVLVAKYNADGTLLWVRQISGSGSQESPRVAAGTRDNIIVAGSFDGDSDFDGDGIAEITNTGNTDLFVAKYDEVGTLLWVRQAGGDGGGKRVSSAVPEGGSVYLAGWFVGGADFDDDGIADVTSTGGSDIFVARYDASGNLLQVRQGGGAHDDYGFGADADGVGYVYTTGSFYQDADFDGDGAAEVNAGSYHRDIFAASYYSPPVPVSPRPTVPVSGATLVPREPALRWDAVVGATSYHLQVSLAPTFEEMLTDEGGLVDTSYQVTVPLPADTSIYWRVLARDGLGVESAWSETSIFTTGGDSVRATLLLSVDMRAEIDRGGLMDDEIVGVRGTPSPLSWTATTAMSDGEGDGVYSVDVEFVLSEDTPVEYQFVQASSDDSSVEWEFGPPEENDVFRVIGFDSDSTTSSVSWGEAPVDSDPVAALPSTYALHPPYPNPSHDDVTIRIDLPEPADVRLAVYDVVGRRVEALIDERRAAGTYQIRWAADGVASGFYVCRLRAGGFAAARMVVVL